MKTIDLFSGCGGMSLGFQQAGFEILAAFDHWGASLEVYRANFTHSTIESDLSNVIDNIPIIQSYQPEVIIGGPPCQDFSHAGKRDENLGRADLTVAFARIVTCVLPRFFVMENVDQIHKSKRLAEAKTLFRQAGYGLSESTLEAHMFGVPQFRKRYFLIGQLSIQDDFFGFESMIKHPFINIRQYFHFNQLPLNTEFYYRHPRTYARRAIYSIDEPSPTIRGVNRPIPETYKPHPLDAALPSDKVRPLTTLERSYIQTFPKAYKWLGTKTNLEQMIGNAVPVVLAQAIAQQLLLEASNRTPSHKTIQDSLFAKYS
jgi:DNA (cytosine-5)-methyltransferase 1